MMTLVGGLCGLCAIGALLEMILPDGNARENLRLICGLLMLLYVLQGIQKLGESAVNASSAAELMDVLIG